MASTQSADLELSSTQYFTAADSASLSITGSLTAAAWVNLESALSTNQEVRLISKGYLDNSHRSYEFGFFDISGTKYLQFSCSALGSGGTTSQVTYTVPTGTWVHIAAVYTTIAGTVDFYVNGSQQGTQQSGASATIFDSSSVLGVGAGSNGGNGFDGKLFDVRLWARALNSTEIGNLYSTPCTFNNGSSLAAWYEFASGAETTDSSGNTNTLTNVNSVTFSADVPYSCSVGPANVKTWDGLASASVKTVNGLAIASVKTANGLA